MIFIVDKHLHSTFNLYGIFNSRLHSRNDYIAFLLILKILDCVAWLLAPYFFEIWKLLNSFSFSLLHKLSKHAPLGPLSCNIICNPGDGKDHYFLETMRWHCLLASGEGQGGGAFLLLISCHS